MFLVGHLYFPSKGPRTEVKYKEALINRYTKDAPELYAFLTIDSFNLALDGKQYSVSQCTKWLPPVNIVSETPGLSVST